jgi:CheY-like chemotaxis protein
VAHDVNQMLAVIIGRAELLLRRTPDGHPHLEAILLAARDAGFMLGRLDGGRAGQASAGVTPVTGLLRVVNQAALLVLPPDGSWCGSSPAAGRWTLDNRVEPAAGLAVPDSVLREVLANLLLNALGVMPNGGHIVVDSVQRDANLCLRVSDSGPGLSDDGAARVFEAGFTTSGGAGRGIGLAACRQLLEAHGGTLTAQPRGGPGAIFMITAPALAVVAPGTIPADSVDARAYGAGSGFKDLAVVVIDDEAAVREMLADVLGELGCRVVCHRDGASALAAGAPGDAAVALVDRRLPGMDGVELAGRLRERRAALAVVMMTGWNREETPPPPAVADFTAHKPLGIDVLQDLLTRASVLYEGRRRAEGLTPGGS